MEETEEHKNNVLTKYGETSGYVWNHILCGVLFLFSTLKSMIRGCS